MADTLYFDPSQWSVGDLEDFEEMTGMSLDEAFSPSARKDSRGEVVKDEKGRPEKSIKLNAKVLVAIAFIEGRILNPEFTVAEARKVKATALQLPGGDTPDPEGNGGDSAA